MSDMANVLFLCTGNSARSILAEALLTHWGAGRFRGYSAGSHPKGEVHPLALSLLQQMHLPTEGLRSKSWDEFASGPAMHYVVTVCDNATNEICPIWPGHPVTAHWGIPDPAAATGTQAQQMSAFREAARVLDLRIRHFLAFQCAGMDRARVQDVLRRVGQMWNPPVVETP
jgi:arsenate reductase